MGQANKTCPECGRTPGTRHDFMCSRAMPSVKALRRNAEHRGKPITLYPGKGAVVASFEDVDGARHRLVNRGVPYVTEGPGKSPFQGGLPRGVTKEDLAEEVAFFRQGMSFAQARLDALQTAQRARPPEDTDGRSIEAVVGALGLTMAKYRAATLEAQRQREAVVVFASGELMVAVSPEGGLTVIDPETMALPVVNEMADIDFNEAEARCAAHLAEADMVLEDGTTVDFKTTDNS